MTTTTAETPPTAPPQAMTNAATPPPLDRGELRAVMKEAVVEALREQRELIAEIVIQAIEDIALARAIDEGRDTEIVPVEEVYRILDELQCES